jgi:hypothetical protein
MEINKERKNERKKERKKETRKRKKNKEGRNIKGNTYTSWAL